MAPKKPKRSTRAGVLPPWLNVRRLPRLKAVTSPPPWPILAEEVWDRAGPWDDPRVSEALRALRQQFYDTGARMMADLAGVRWADVDSYDLMALVEAGMRVEVGIRSLENRATTPAHMYFYETLLRQGLLAVLMRESRDPLGPALTSLAAHLSVPYAWKEMNRRGAQQVGYAAAGLLWAAAVEQLRNQSGAVSRTVNDAVQFLARRVRRKDRLENPSEAPSFVFETVAKRWGTEDPLELVARSLDGELNIAPQAIADDILDETRKRQRQERLGVVMREDSERDDVPEWFENLPAPGRTEDAAAFQELLERVNKHPRLCRLVEAYLAGALTQGDVARRCGVTVRTVKNWEHELRELLRPD